LSALAALELVFGTGMAFSRLLPSLDGNADDLLLLAYATVGLFLFRLKVETISLPRLERVLKRAARDNPKYDAKEHAFGVFDQLFGVLCKLLMVVQFIWAIITTMSLVTVSC
jgi:hypothetical protein